MCGTQLNFPIQFSLYFSIVFIFIMKAIHQLWSLPNRVPGLSKFIPPLHWQNSLPFPPLSWQQHLNHYHVMSAWIERIKKKCPNQLRETNFTKIVILWDLSCVPLPTYLTSNGIFSHETVLNTYSLDDTLPFLNVKLRHF